jgi:hypothetical protein
MSDGRSSAVTRTQYAPPSARIAKSKETFMGLEYGLIPFQPVPSGVQAVAAVVERQWPVFEVH